jgi:hypothetical protein
MSRATYADDILAKLFVRGQPAPSSKQVYDAYPHGERAMHPYKVWLKRVKAWRLAHAAGRSAPPCRQPRAEDDHETLEMFASPEP